MTSDVTVMFTLAFVIELGARFGLIGIRLQNGLYYLGLD